MFEFAFKAGGRMEMEAIKQNLPYFFYPILSPEDQLLIIERQASEGQEGFIMPFRVSLQDGNSYQK